MTARLQLVRPAEWDPLLGGTVHYFGGQGEGITELEAEPLRAHLDRLGPRPDVRGPAGARLIDALAELELTGRGGGHFPVARKWRAVQHRAPGTAAVVVANGAEGEPLSAKDAALLELRPHLVLDGLACAAEALGAQTTIVWLHAGAHAARAALTRAMSERAHTLAREPQARVALAPDHYLSGESSAAVRALSGGPALPEFRRVPTAVSGVSGRPTLVQNVETLARVALAARGLDATGSTLLTVTTPAQRVVVEAGAQAYLQDAIGSVLAGARTEAVLLGGYGGRWVPWSALDGARASEPDLNRRGLSLGAGVVLPLPPGECGLERAATIVDYLAEASARQCGPCLFGLRAIADTVGALAARRAGRRDLKRLDRFLAEVHGRGGCHHPDGAVAMVASALETFAEDVAAHRRGRCVRTGGRGE